MYLHSQPHFFFPCLIVAKETSEERNNNGGAGDSVLTVILTLALSEASISQIKQLKLGCTPVGHSETAPRDMDRNDGVLLEQGVWQRACTCLGCMADHYVPCCAGWVGPTVLLCIYGFCFMMRPIEPFMTEFLTGPCKNLTIEQVRR